MRTPFFAAQCAALLALAAACAPQRDIGTPGERPGGRTHPAAAAAPTVYALFGHREALALSSAQVAAIDSIGGWLQLRNEALLDSLRLGDDGRTSRLPADSADALMERIRANQRAAVDGVAAALTAEQRGRACQLFAEQRGERERRSRGGRPSLARRPRGSARDTLPGGPRARWGWCAPSAVAAAPAS
ncbi:MAG TPA: hypothetical protein VF615_19120 [Longimicrobiaceae bacterium]|jgi:hypothetical protein